MTKDLVAQLQNPEVKVDPNPDPQFAELAKQLQTLKTVCWKQASVVELFE